MEQNNASNILIPGLTPEQSKNTVLFLQFACTSYTPGCKSLILKQSVLKHNQYERKRNPDTGKMEFVYNNGERILKGHAGKDWTKPAIYDLVTSPDLMSEHDYHYPHKEVETYAFWDEENKKCIIVENEKYVPERRPALIDAIIHSDEKTKYLFVPALVEPHKMMCRRKTSKGISYRTQNNYSTKDVRYGRCLWVDIDGHDFPDEQIGWLNLMAVECLMQILPNYCAQTGVPIPAVVNSGRGVHLFWWLDKPVRISEKPQQAQFKWLLNQLANWARKLIEQDEVCRDIWKPDNAATANHQSLVFRPHWRIPAAAALILPVKQEIFEFFEGCKRITKHRQLLCLQSSQVLLWG